MFAPKLLIKRGTAKITLQMTYDYMSNSYGTWACTTVDHQHLSKCAQPSPKYDRLG